MFERAYRVQMNTLEQLVGFLPALLIAGIYWPQAVVAPVGVVYLLGRALYRHRYMQDPARRGPSCSPCWPRASCWWRVWSAPWCTEGVNEPTMPAHPAPTRPGGSANARHSPRYDCAAP
jgi:hypothetical protein